LIAVENGYEIEVPEIEKRLEDEGVARFTVLEESVEVDVSEQSGSLRGAAVAKL
jgi:hypothetical protein